MLLILSHESNTHSIESDLFLLEFNSPSSKLDPLSHESELSFCEPIHSLLNYLDSCAIDLHSCGNNSIYQFFELFAQLCKSIAQLSK